jgi:ankyrin repeat protein
MLIDVGANPSVSNFEGDTPLLMACQAGNLTLAKRLRDAGANVSVANRRGDTPLLD